MNKIENNINNSHPDTENEIILYQPDSTLSLNVRVENEDQCNESFRLIIWHLLRLYQFFCYFCIMNENTPIPLAPSSQDNEIILYQPDSTVKIEVRLVNETVWLSQQQIADLFGVKQPAISKHLKNIFESGELVEASVHSILEYTANDGKTYKTKFYNLDAILSVGYRVNSKNATLFRQWANKILKEYLMKGYAVSQRFETSRRGWRDSLHSIHKQDIASGSGTP